MPLSAPIHRLKRTARDNARTHSVPLHAALDQVATEEGFQSWSHLSAQHPGPSMIGDKLYAELRPGDMVLVAARPQQGKTMLALSLALTAIAAGKAAYMFSLEYKPAMIEQRMTHLPETLARHARRLVIDCDDTICAGHIMSVLTTAPAGAVAVIDYLQLLDQKRTNPPLQEQIVALARFARARGVTLVFISQIDRRFDPEGETQPSFTDIRLPNPLDLTLFNKTWFLHAGRVTAGTR